MLRSKLFVSLCLGMLWLGGGCGDDDGNGGGSGGSGGTPTRPIDARAQDTGTGAIDAGTQPDGDGGTPDGDAGAGDAGPAPTSDAGLRGAAR